VIYFDFRNILFKHRRQLLFEEKGELLTKKVEAKYVVEKIFKEILNSKDGDYIFKAQVLAAMKPNGW